MQLSSVSDQQLIEMMTWFSNEEELNIWSGPNFTYPYDLRSFKKDLKLETLKSYALLSKESHLLAFGQYYLRLGKCHLGRLIVNPHYRGRGIAAHLIQALSTEGKKDLNVSSCSLFVLAHNKSAINAYKKRGFALADYPEKLALAHCLYMVKDENQPYPPV